MVPENWTQAHTHSVPFHFVPTRLYPRKLRRASQAVGHHLHSANLFWGNNRCPGNHAMYLARADLRLHLAYPLGKDHVRLHRRLKRKYARGTIAGQGKINGRRRNGNFCVKESLFVSIWSVRCRLEGGEMNHSVGMKRTPTQRTNS